MSDEDAVLAAVLEHVDSWLDGDPVRMERTLAPEYSALATLSPQDLIEATAKGHGRSEDTDDREILIDISYLQGDEATVTCVSHRYLERLELIRTPEGWKILNGICQSQAECAPLALPMQPGSSEGLRRDSGRRHALFSNPCEGRTQRRRPGPGGRRGGHRR